MEFELAVEENNANAFLWLMHLKAFDGVNAAKWTGKRLENCVVKMRGFYSKYFMERTEVKV